VNTDTEDKKKPERKGLLKWVMKFMLEIVMIVIIVSGSWLLASENKGSKASLSYSDFTQAVTEQKVDHVTIIPGTNTLGVTYKDGSEYTTVNLLNDSFYKDLMQSGVSDIRTQGTTSKGYLSNAFSIILILIVPYVIIKLFAMQGKRVGKMMSRDDVELDVKNKVTFADVAGMSEEKEELQFAIDSLKSFARFKERGLRPVKGVLLTGPPGVGKTLIAKAIAGEAGVKFLSFSAPSFNSLFVGNGQLGVRRMFKQAIRNKPCIVFIDEIDALGRKRSNSNNGSDERDSTINALLERMDGVSSEEGILFIAATNRADILDDALIRPGRFDKTIHVGAPKSKKDREEIVAVHLRNKTLKEGVTVEQVGKLCFEMTGAEIEGVLNDAIMESFKAGEDGIIDLPHIDAASMKMRVKGVLKGSWDGEVLKRVAIHEMGHALMNEHLGRKVIKVSVQPYSSGVGGITVTDGDSQGSTSIRTRAELRNDIKVLYAGMVAEEVVLGDISTGNANDLERATHLLYNMCQSWGMGGTLLSGAVMSQVKGINGVSDLNEENMESLGASLRREVFSFFQQPAVTQRLIALSEQLEKEEVMYSLPEPKDVTIELETVPEGA
jgi:cell division protease FtsH